VGDVQAGIPPVHLPETFRPTPIKIPPWEAACQLRISYFMKFFSLKQKSGKAFYPQITQMTQNGKKRTKDRIRDLERSDLIS
jgi:hypothetical protein